MDPYEFRSFAQAVADIVALIPPGRATSYGAIARAAGYPTLSRLAGKVLSQSGRSHDLPAHRVVNSSGVLSGRRAFGPGDEQARLLESEGMKVTDDRIRHWKAVFWDPVKEICP